LSADPREFLFSLEQFGIKLGLDQIRALLAALDHPESTFRSIGVAGTNGKGSVTAMVERGLRAAGSRTGRYISPHLVRLEERFAIDGVDTTATELDRAADRMRDAARSLPYPPSFFEATTAMALDLFRSARVDVAVLEVGLGGRLDATNIVPTIAQAIAAIDYDHQQYLGDTIEAIAREKAGIIKPGGVVVLGGNPPEVREVVASEAARQGARYVYALDDVVAQTQVTDGVTTLMLKTPHRSYPGMRLALRGRHQVANAITAVRLLEELTAEGALSVPDEAIRTAVELVIWPARLELIRSGATDILIDGAHNPAGARALASYLDETYGRRLPIVFGAMRDKDLDGLVAAIAPVASHFVLTAAGSTRAATPDDLEAVAGRVAPDVPRQRFSASVDALEFARGLDRVVVVAGSLYLAGEIRDRIA
jgi:dihydrofolate synthase/folylpolyglutamate synthase